MHFQPPALLDVREVARLLNCSPRHVHRLSLAGKMPSALRLGALVRWRRGEIEDWINDGCEPMREQTSTASDESSTQ
jgi:excisionase family DNA binding protein